MGNQEIDDAWFGLRVCRAVVHIHPVPRANAPQSDCSPVTEGVPGDTVLPFRRTPGSLWRRECSIHAGMSQSQLFEPVMPWQRAHICYLLGNGITREAKACCARHVSQKSFQATGVAFIHVIA